MMMTVLLFLLVAVAPGQTFYVSPQGSDANPGTKGKPFKSLERARDQVRRINRGAARDVTVYLRSGRYELASPVHFTEADSGADGRRVTYASHPGETAVLTGGRLVSGWTPAGNGLFKAPLGPLGGDIRTRQLYVNGRRAVWARTPEPDAWPSTGSDHQLLTWDEPNKRVGVAATDLAGLSLGWRNVEVVIEKQARQDIYRARSAAPRSPTETWINLRRIYWAPEGKRVCHYY